MERRSAGTRTLLRSTFSRILYLMTNMRYTVRLQKDLAFRSGFDAFRLPMPPVLSESVDASHQ